LTLVAPTHQETRRRLWHCLSQLGSHLPQKKHLPLHRQISNCTPLFPTASSSKDRNCRSPLTLTTDQSEHHRRSIANHKASAALGVLLREMFELPDQTLRCTLDRLQSAEFVYRAAGSPESFARRFSRARHVDHLQAGDLLSGTELAFAVLALEVAATGWPLRCWPTFEALGRPSIPAEGENDFMSKTSPAMSPKVMMGSGRG
jgi:hypothetical protein